MPKKHLGKERKPKSQKKDTYIIIGDWVVDEYWFLVRHHSQISSHTGFIHYRISSDKSEIVSDLCGAGHIARILYQYREDNKKNYKIYCIGKWNSKDTEYIAHLVHARSHPECDIAKATYTIAREICKNEPNLKLATLVNDAPTNRVIRLYHNEKGEYVQLNRIDWEPPLSEKESIGENIAFEKIELPKGNAVGAIIVNDLDKGAISTILIKELKRRYPNAPWFVRSKKLKPEWLDEIGSFLRLIVIGPEVAAKLHPWERWLPNGHLAVEAIDILKSLPGDNVILTSDQHEVIAKLNKGEDCITGLASKHPTILSQLGWPTAFFASVVVSMLENNATIGDEKISNALDYADKYSGILTPKTVLIKEKSRERTKPIGKKWGEEITLWENSWKDIGTFKDKNGQETLEVWRASGQLPNYISCIKEKREIIERIGQKLRAFKKASSPQHSLSILFQADAGAGKTFLAEALSQEFGFPIIRYDVTQMMHREELLDLFEIVATAQTGGNRSPLVFVDEINALLENEHVYGAFLAPLEQGIYVRRGKKFSLRPCVWMFAGTKLDEETREKDQKFSDFESRMTLIERIDYKSLMNSVLSKCGKDTKNILENQAKLREMRIFEDQARLEQVYLGAIMILREHSDVQYISRDILEFFYGIDPAQSPARKIRKRAQSLSDVQYGYVRRKNCESWGVKWPNENESNLVKIVA